MQAKNPEPADFFVGYISRQRGRQLDALFDHARGLARLWIRHRIISPQKYVPGGVFGFNPSLAALLIERVDGQKLFPQGRIFLVKNAGSWFWNIETEKSGSRRKLFPDFWNKRTTHRITLKAKKEPGAILLQVLQMVGENGFEPLKPKQQIYSLPPLTTRELSHMIAFDVGGAGGRIRTPDLLITNQLLYQLSYTSESTVSR